MFRHRPRTARPCQFPISYWIFFYSFFKKEFFIFKLDFIFFKLCYLGKINFPIYQGKNPPYFTKSSHFCHIDAVNWKYLFVIQIFLLIGQCILFCKYWVDVQCSYYWYWVEINYLEATFTWYVEHNIQVLFCRRPEIYCCYS